MATWIGQPSASIIGMAAWSPTSLFSLVLSHRTSPSLVEVEIILHPSDFSAMVFSSAEWCTNWTDRRGDRSHGHDDEWRVSARRHTRRRVGEVERPRNSQGLYS